MSGQTHSQPKRSARNPSLWRGVMLTGALTPNGNDTGFSALGSATTVETIFATAGLLNPAALKRWPICRCTIVSSGGVGYSMGLLIASKSPFRHPVRTAPLGLGLQVIFSPAPFPLAQC